MAEPGATALVTGASSGLGREFVRQLAKRCDRIIAVARRRECLEALAGDLAAEAVVEPLACDLATVEGQARVAELLRQRAPVSTLVNNAGSGSFGLLADSDPARDLAMLRLHCEATVYLCRVAVPFLAGHGSGAIINVASAGALLPMPRSALYGATKAFVLQFSRSLAAELRGRGIVVQALCPGFTRTGFFSAEGLATYDAGRVAEAAWESPAAVVAESLERLATGDELVITGVGNRGAVAQGLRDLAGSVDE